MGCALVRLRRRVGLLVRHDVALEAAHVVRRPRRRRVLRLAVNKAQRGIESRQRLSRRRACGHGVVEAGPEAPQLGAHRAQSQVCNLQHPLCKRGACEQLARAAPQRARGGVRTRRRGATRRGRRCRGVCVCDGAQEALLVARPRQPPHAARARLIARHAALSELGILVSAPNGLENLHIERSSWPDPGKSRRLRPWT